MGYVYNKELPNEIVLTEYQKCTYYDGNSWSYAFYLLERPVPVNIADMLRATSQTTNYVLLKNSTDDVSYIMRVVVTDTTISLEWGSGNGSGGGYTKISDIASFSVNSIPDIYNMYFLYTTAGSGSQLLKLMPTIDQHNFIAIKVEQISPQYPDGYLCGEVSHIKYDLIAFNAYNFKPDYNFNINEFYRDPLCVASSPNQFIKLTNSADWSDNEYALLATTLSALTGGDNNSGEEYYGPTPTPDPEQPFEPSVPEPYSPTQDPTSDIIPIPGNPTFGVSTTGMIHVYKISTNDLTSLADTLFPFQGTPTDVVEAVTMLYNVVANSNLINYVLDCHVIPVTPQTGSNEHIKVGYKTTNISVPKVTNDYVDATCGSLNIREWFSGYQDYALTRSKLYLPFIGFVDTKPEYWQSGTIKVDYKFNIIDGSFMCYIRATSSKSQLADSVIAQYGGNACMHFPMTGVNYANMVSGIIGAGVAIATGGASAAAIAGGAMSALNTIIQKGDVQQSNGYNSTSALMGVRTPYLLIERPVPATPSNYGHDNGFPANITTMLSNVVGYTVIEDIDLSGIPLTQTELEELRSLLKEGVYF